MFTLEVTAEERDELIRLLESALSETKIEVRRTRNPEWRDKLHQQEAVVVSLLERLRELEVPVA